MISKCLSHSLFELFWSINAHASNKEEVVCRRLSLWRLWLAAFYLLTHSSEHDSSGTMHEWYLSHELLSLYKTWYKTSYCNHTISGTFDAAILILEPCCTTYCDFLFLYQTRDKKWNHTLLQTAHHESDFQKRCTWHTAVSLSQLFFFFFISAASFLHLIVGKKILLEVDFYIKLVLLIKLVLWEINK